VFRVVVVLATGLIFSGCVTKTKYDALQQQHDETVAVRDDLETQVERLELERDSFETQYIDTQESYEDERVTRVTLAKDLARVESEASRLDRDLEAERLARVAATDALIVRETQLTSMQGTYDELVGDLESELSAGQIEIERLREGLRLNVSDDVLFASGSAKLDQIGREVLLKVAARVKDLDDSIEVRGHTDNLAIGGVLAQRFPSNWELAAARASSVVRLLEEEGVSGDRLMVVSLGPNDPIEANDSAVNRARNRRIEIRLTPRTGPDSNHED
jgi:chemotaxis protein MotB